MKQSARTPWKDVLVALLATALALLVRWPLWPLLGDKAPFITLFPAVAVSGWYGGLRAAALATILGAAGALFLISEPRFSLAIAERPDAVSLVVFVAMGGLISWISHERHRAILRLQGAHERERQARLEAQHTADRMSRLQEITAVIAGAATTAQVVEMLLGRGPAILDACGGAIALLDEEKHELELLGATGPAGDREPGAPAQRIPLGASLPLAEAVRLRRPIVRGALATSNGIDPTPRVDVRAPLAGRAEVALPLMVKDRILGALGLQFAVDRRFSPEDLDFLLSLTSGCAQALERARAYEAAEMANRAKDEFLALLGHELRNPLAPIVTALQLLRMRSGGELGREEEVIERQVQHLERMVDDLLDVSRIARGMIALHKRPIELGSVVARALEIASPILESRHHHVTTELVPGLRLEADPDRLAQILVNLLTNAAKYTTPGGRIGVAAALEDGELVLRVKDNGMGMSPELLHRVFEPFVQGAQGPERRAGGLGIGLTLVRSLVAMHGGRVEAHSDGVGQGSEFVIHLPALAQEAAAEVSRAEAPRAAPSLRRVLVVDDNEDAAELLAEVLRTQGWQVVVASDGPQALALLGEFHPDVAVLDIGLPVMDGYELAGRIRERLGDAAPYLLAVTGYGQDKDRARSREAGFARHFVKPVRAEALIEAIAEGVGRGPAAASADPGRRGEEFQGSA